MDQKIHPIEQIQAGVNPECVTGDVKCLPLLIAFSALRAKLLNGAELSIDEAIDSLCLCEKGPTKSRSNDGTCGGVIKCQHPAVEGIEGSNQQAKALLDIIVE